MPHFFENFPTIDYDLQRNGTIRTIQNPLVRFKLLEALKNNTVLYYTHDIREGQTVQYIANRYYGDSTLDWVLFITNDILDPVYDLPLDYQDFVNFVVNKYGSIESAMNTVHHYEWIYQSSSKLSDGTIIKEKKLEVDSTTYAGLSVSEKREVSNYDYEVDLNDSKRTIKVIHKDYITKLLNETKSIFD